MKKKFFLKTNIKLMPKIATNNRISGNSINDTIIQHSLWLNQDVRNDASPTFSNIRITNNAEIDGDLYVYGSATIFNTNITEFEDNIILINRNETSAGVSLGESGFQVNRGTLDDYYIIYSEPTQTFRAGYENNTHAVALREDVPLNNGIFVWNDSIKQIVSSDTITLPIKLTSAQNAVNSSTGALVLLNGGIASKNMFISEELILGGNDSNGNLFMNINDSLCINSPNDLLITCGNFSLNGFFFIAGTENAVNVSSASFYTFGGFSAQKDVYIEGSFRGKKTTGTSDNLILQNSAGNTLLSINDTTTNISTPNINFYTNNFNINNSNGNILSLQNSQIIFNSTVNSSDISLGSVIFNGGVSFGKNINILGGSKFYSNINMNNNYIQNVLDPINPLDVANKNYVDLVSQGLSVKEAVEVATITAGNLISSFISGQTVDSYVLTIGNRLLIKNQINQVENGIYTVNSSGSPSRTIDFNTGFSAGGSFVFVKNGGLQENLGFICNSPTGLDIVGTDPITFTEFTGLGQVSAGAGLSKNLNELSVNVDNSSIEIFNDNLRIKNTITGAGLTGGSGSVLQTTTDQTHVNKIGTLTEGIWNASVINVPYGGSGRNLFTLNNLIFGNGTSGLLQDSLFLYNPTNNNLNIGLNNTFTRGTLNIKSINDNTILNIINNSDASSILNFSSIANLILQSSNNLLITNTYGNIKINNLTLATNSNIGINTTSPNYTLDNSGGSFATNLIVGINGNFQTISASNILCNSFVSNDNLPIFNINSTVSSNTGIGWNRYQENNNSGQGDIINNDNSVYTDILPSQIGILINQVRFSTSANSSNNFYNNYWIKFNSQVRKIISYSGGTRLATLETNWQTAPVITDTIDFFNNNIPSLIYNENNKEFTLNYIKEDNGYTTQNTIDYLSFKSKDIYLTNNSLGIFSNGAIYVNNTQNSTNTSYGGAFTSLGGGSFIKDLYLGSNLIMGDGSTENSLNINNRTMGISLINNNTTGNFINWKNSSNVSYGLKNHNTLFHLTLNSAGNNPNDISNLNVITINSQGNIGLGTSTINSLITLKANSQISTDNSTGKLSILSADNSSNGASIDLYTNSLSNGSIVLNSNNIILGNGISIGNNNLVSSFTQNSVNSSTGSVVLQGGLSINNSENATNFTNGGSFTNNGGGSFKKDLYIGGNLYLDGDAFFNSITNANISFNTSGISSFTVSNQKIINLNNEIILSFNLACIPNTNAPFITHNLPLKISNINSPTDYIANIQGYYDLNNWHSIFNIVSAGITGGTNSFIKFQSSNTTSPHYFNVISRYTI